MVMSRLSSLWRYLWAAPASAAGLIAAGLACALGATARVTDGVLEIAGGRLGACAASASSRWGFAAITFGHVVIGQSHSVLAALRAHEHAHVRQYERWGIFLFVLYPASSAWQLLRGRGPYWHNTFERQARAAQTAVTAPERNTHV